ncbi:hypothetical protein ABIF62_007872 [Bradyrhizobium japonicum]
MKRMPASSRRGDQARERLAGHHRPGRIGRAADQHALQRRLAMRRQQRLAGQRVARVIAGLDQHRLATERGEDVTVGRIARHRHGDAVAGREHRQESQDEAAGGACRHHDPLGADVTAIGIPIVARDAFAQ